MRAHAPIIPDDRLDMIVEGQNLGLEADFLAEFSQRRLMQGLADFDDAARQRIEPEQWRTRPARDQHAVRAKDRRRDGKDRARRIEAVVQGRTSSL
jgi:hypothetical protein